MSEIKYMDIAEFREEGYLQEINRRFLHPLGLALEVTRDVNGTEYISGVWDYRDDPEGVVFAEGVMDSAKTNRIHAQQRSSYGRRLKALGYWIQPLP